MAQASGKKGLAERTDIEIEISNQCSKLIANAIILSRLLTKYEASENAKALALIAQMSLATYPVERALHLPERRQDN